MGRLGIFVTRVTRRSLGPTTGLTSVYTLPINSTVDTGSRVLEGALGTERWAFPFSEVGYQKEELSTFPKVSLFLSFQENVTPRETKFHSPRDDIHIRPFVLLSVKMSSLSFLGVHRSKQGRAQAHS